jgi:hypothetical protein
MAIRDIVVVGFSAGGIDPMPDMPRAARRAGTVDRISPLGDIAATFKLLVGPGITA